MRKLINRDRRSEPEALWGFSDNAKRKGRSAHFPMDTALKVREDLPSTPVYFPFFSSCDLAGDLTIDNSSPR